MRTSIKITILLIYLAAALPFIYGYETWNYVNNAYITGYSPSCNPYQGLRFLYGANLNSGTAVLNCGGFSKSFNGQGYIMWISDMSNPCNATLTVVTDSKTIISSMPYHVREGIYSIEDGKLNGLPVCPQGQSCFDGVCCTPDCSCSVNTCSGSACSDSCGGFCEGTKQPECSCSVDTCIGQICSDGCGEVCEGKKACKSGEPKVRKVTYEYDLYGNIVKAANLGDIYLTGDEKFSYTEYLYNTDDWIINKPRRNYLKDDASLVSETKFAYDGKNYGSYPTKGDLTYEEYWLDSGPSPVNSYDYDSYGNVITHTNPRGYAITYTYDPTNSFLTRTANAKGHQINYAYDPGTGNLLSSKDANGYITEYAYDTFGRKIKEVLPYDTQNYPTLEIKYYLDGAAPEQIEIIQREVGGTSEAHESYSYLDGFLIAVQNKEETEGSQLTTRDITYDPLYRIKEQSNPYKSSLGYTNPQNVSRKVYSYDSLGRITQTTNPDGTAKKVDYNLWDSTTYDEKGDQKDYTQDAHGRIISVKEYDGQQVYETRYGYDALNNLKEIIDSKGNKIAYGYDSLGRKTGLHDKDIGSWSYSYDSNGNLVRQTDSKGHSTYLSYDELDRLSKKSSPGIDTEYFYDIVTIGTLYKITHPGIETIFQYDSRLRLIDEQKKIEGIVFNAHYSYDSMDRLASKTLPDNSVIEYSYDKEGFVDSIEGLIPHIEYNEMGQPTKRTYDNGIVTNLQYDSDNHRLRRIVTGDKQDLSYSYDDVGNVIRISDSIKGKERLFAYDGLDRLISAKRSSDFDIDYGYDSIGNMLGLSSERLNISFGYSSLPVHSPSSIVYKDSCDVDGDAAKGASCHGDDCDDDNPDIFPGALEIC
ncbi:MAG TPA: hypothetical protein VFF28_07180, partial [Candidatus Nanoarchaeia archaeon]|nr:hypothetical protein [Candidatus Nanoarchaeia archaeon]